MKLTFGEGSERVHVLEHGHERGGDMTEGCTEASTVSCRGAGSSVECDSRTEPSISS